MNDNGLNGSTRAFKGIWIPAAILNNSNLCWTDKILWSIVDSFTGEGGCCFATNAYFSRLLGIGERGVQKALTRLKDAGLLLTYGDGGNEKRQLVAVAPKDDSASSPRVNASSGEEVNASSGEGGEREFVHIIKNINKKYIYNYNPPTPFGGCPPYGVDPHLEDEGGVLNPPMPSDEGERLSNSYRISCGKSYRSQTQERGGIIIIQINTLKSKSFSSSIFFGSFAIFHAASVAE